ncbi:lachesicidin-like [Nothobranchius furzeri]|uniref:lachesicidin-like n=1 Tax=Nothobranchius furzeri TaxID=105023 RepID=UPI003904A826
MEGGFQIFWLHFLFSLLWGEEEEEEGEEEEEKKKKKKKEKKKEEEKEEKEKKKKMKIFSIPPVKIKITRRFTKTKNVKI